MSQHFFIKIKKALMNLSNGKLRKNASVKGEIFPQHRKVIESRRFQQQAS